jgi:hypothetical protein
VSYAFFSKSGFAPEARAAAKGYTSLWITLERIDEVLRQLAA